MGLYKNFIDVLRHTKDNKAFTTDEVVTALELTGTNAENIATNKANIAINKINIAYKYLSCNY